jgi:hypothetical protein
MSQAGIDALVERYLDDPQFRTDFSRNPEAAVRRAGFDLDDEELVALHAADGVRLGEALRSRISRASFGV